MIRGVSWVVARFRGKKGRFRDRLAVLTDDGRISRYPSRRVTCDAKRLKIAASPHAACPNTPGDPAGRRTQPEGMDRSSGSNQRTSRDRPDGDSAS